MKKTSLLFAFAALVPNFSYAFTVETAIVHTARGADVSVALDLPDNLSGKAATVVIAPGQGYHMDLPIVRQLAEKLAGEGKIAVRFNWNYFTADPKNGQPSADLSKEVQDMQAVVDFALADVRVDGGQLVLAGKSLGSMVSYQVFAKNPAAKALVLITPVCTSSYDDNDQPLPAPVPSGAQNYPEFSAQTRPVFMVLGNADPLCSLPMLYDFLKDTKGNVAMATVGGDHSWNVSKGTDDESARRNAGNITQGVQLAAHWISLFLGK